MPSRSSSRGASRPMIMSAVGRAVPASFLCNANRNLVEQAGFTDIRSRAYTFRGARDGSLHPRDRNEDAGEAMSTSSAG